MKEILKMVSKDVGQYNISVVTNNHRPPNASQAFLSFHLMEMYGRWSHFVLAWSIWTPKQSFMELCSPKMFIEEPWELRYLQRYINLHNQSIPQMSMRPFQSFSILSFQHLHYSPLPI